MDAAIYEEPWFGQEQEYFIIHKQQEFRALGWPEKGEPSGGQGAYYCGILPILKIGR